MPVNPQQLPYQITKDAVSGANTRAVQNVLMTLPRFVSATFDSQYSEPMPLNVGALEPQAIELVRIVNLRAPETPVACGSMVHWVYRPDQGGAQITSIDGLSPLDGNMYRFTFRITYKAQV
jgi:hypothetical protein